MNHHVLRLASRLISVPFMADIAYGPIGRFVETILREVRFAAAAAFPVPLKRFARSYLTPSRGLSLWITNVCNARCNFCAYPQIAADKTRLTGSMPMDVFQRAVDEYAASGGKHVDMTPTIGDPLLDPTLVEKIKYCREKARLPGVSLTTNAILLHRNEMFKRVVDAGLTMMAISLPDLNAEIYKRIYGVDRCAEVIKSLKALFCYNRERGEPVRIILRFRNNRKPSAIIRSKEFQEHVRPYLSAMVTCNFTVDFDNWGGAITPEILDGRMLLKKPSPHYHVPCVGLSAFVVQYDGAVRLCGCRLKNTEKDELIVGNIKEKSLAEIGQSEEVHKLMEGFYQGKRPPVCQECTLYTPMSRQWVNKMWGHKGGEKGATPNRPAHLGEEASQPGLAPLARADSVEP